MGWNLGKNGRVLVSVTAEIHFVSVDDSYDDDDDNDASMLLQPGSRQLPRWVEELDGMRLCPLGKHGLLRDETVSSIWGTLVQEILSTLVSAARLVIMVGNLFVILCLAIGVIYHAVDMDLFAHVHGEDEREPARAEVGAGLDPPVWEC